MKPPNQLVLKHSIEIETIPEKIWEFFINLDKNYKKWHPDDHVLFKWKKGDPLEEGSTCYAEQYINGKLTRYKTKCVDIIKYRRIAFKFGFPISIVTPRIEWLIEPKGNKTMFTAITYMRFGKFLQRLFKKEMKKLVESHDKHVAFEGENLKRILECRNNLNSKE
jgi:hypothetical protein